MTPSLSELESLCERATKVFPAPWSSSQGTDYVLPSGEYGYASVYDADGETIVGELDTGTAKLIAALPALIARVKELEADAARLDFLDELNAKQNERYGSNYGWRININHNRVALEDHAWPKLTARQAIDAALPLPPAPAGEASALAGKDAE